MRTAQANDVLDHVHHATSWRVTAPLRAALELARVAKQRLSDR